MFVDPDVVFLLKSINRTKLELKFITFENNSSRTPTINRTKLELKYKTINEATKTACSINRTKLELK